MILKSHARAGFTLVEVMLAITIIGALTAVFYAGFKNYITRSKIATTKTTLKTIQSGIDMFNLDTGHYPDTLKDLIVKPAKPEMSGWSNAYIPGKESPKDAWGKPIMYNPTPGGDHEYELYSYGPDGKKAKKSDWIHASY